MNKKLVAAAIAAAMAAPAAFADVTVYGKLHMSADSVDVDKGTATIDLNTNTVTDGALTTYDGQAVTSRASRIGFKGTEDLGNGLKAVWKAEFGIKMDQNSGIDSSRDNYLGLAGNFGTFALGGRVNTPYKNSTGKMDFFGDTLADYNSTLLFEDNRFNNAIFYVSPSMSGLKFSAMVGAGEGADGGKSDSLTDAYSLAATYNNAGIMAAVAYENMEDLATGKNADTKWRVGLGYKMNAFKVAGVYEKQSDLAGAQGLDLKNYQLSVAYSMGNNTVKAMFGQSELSYGSDDAKGDAWAIGVDHKMSKRTKVYALYTDSEMGLHKESSGVIGGTSYSYNATTNVATINGADGSGFSLGMIHSF